MSGSVVRLMKINIQNFKNVRNGVISFRNKRKSFSSSVLGLYGQNGSGKTALIDALQVLKFAMCGMPIPKDYADFVNVESKSSRIEYQFSISTKNNEKYIVYYELYFESIKNDDIEPNTDEINDETANNKIRIYHEMLSYSFEGMNKKIRKVKLIDTFSDNGDDVFSPVSKYNLFFGNDIETKKKLMFDKVITQVSSRSFIFSREFLNRIRTIEQKNCTEDFIFNKNILERMVEYANYELFIIGTANAGMISMNALPLAFRYKHGNTGAIGNMPISLNKPCTIPDDMFKIINGVVDDMNIVLTQLVPGLTISVKDLGSIALKNGIPGHTIQLMSNKNSKLIPLKYESEGIKKIISVLQLLIVLYNVSSITVAIDELDSGIFEYLLGELLRIISEKGKGQLIFTSHNLRPLETIDRGFIAFTTTNPDNRYIRMSNLKENNNLRDFYFRDIVLGEQKEEVYETTNNSEIAFAFREAGERSGS